MFIGHAAVALAVRPKLPRHSLGVLLAAAYFIDIVWPLLLLAGLETVNVHPGDTAFTPLEFVHYPWSHSLLFAALWGVAFAFVVLRGRFGPAREFLGLFALVVSHWALDLVVHRPDLPLYPGSPTVLGFGLWNSVAATILVEGALFAAGLAIYLRSTKAKDRTGTLALGSLVLLLVVIWLSGPFSPPPPGETAIAIVGLLTPLIALWGHWADRHRSLA